MNDMRTIDRLDGELLGELERDARQGIGDLATTLGVTRHTVQSRLCKLEQAGVLSGYVPRLDFAKAGIGVQAFAALALQQGLLDEIIDELGRMPEVLEVHAITGREDLLVRVGTTTHAALQGLIQRIVALPGVSHSNTSLALTNPLPYRTHPLLAQVTNEAGWGRSTPPPR